MCVAELRIVHLEEQLVATRNATERHRLLQIFIKTLVRYQNEVEFSALVARRIEINDEHYKRQKEMIAHLKDHQRETGDAYFLAITLKTMLALYAYYRTMARKIIVCIVHQRN